MKTPALLHIGAATAWQSGNAARRFMQGFLGLSIALLVWMIVWAIQIQVSKRRSEDHPSMLQTVMKTGGVPVCKVVSIKRAVESYKLHVGIVGLLSDFCWGKECLVIAIDNQDDDRIKLKTNEIVIVYLDAAGKIMIKPMGIEFNLLIQYAQRELLDLTSKDPKAFGKVWDKYKEKLENAIYKRRNGHFEA